MASLCRARASSCRAVIAPRRAGHGGAVEGLPAAAGAVARCCTGAHRRGSHGSWRRDCAAAGGAAGAAWAPRPPDPEDDGDRLLLCGPCCGRLVQDPGSAHPGDHKSRGREEDGPGPGGLCAVFPWLLPRYHGGNERSVGGGELVQDPAGLHGCPADQLLHLATSANRKLLLRAPEAQAGRRPVCCHRLELLPLLESKSDVRWKLCPLPASPACVLPESAPSPKPLEQAPVAVDGAGICRAQAAAILLSPWGTPSPAATALTVPGTQRRRWGRVHPEMSQCLRQLCVRQLCSPTRFSVHAHSSAQPLAPQMGCSCPRHCSVLPWWQIGGGGARSQSGAGPVPVQAQGWQCHGLGTALLGAGVSAAEGLPRPRLPAPCLQHLLPQARCAPPKNGVCCSSAADGWNTQ